MVGMEKASGVCINEVLTNNELQAVLAKLQSDKDKEVFGTKQKKLCARAGPLMLCKMATSFSKLVKLDLSQSVF
ncbi:hypothetical protein PVL29_004134 [Vitis rotundifolia]|uniref:Uncharacterized protein n=1 Tax=Vitis rotundifolia TaxID=103349 RepID=A0AA39A773_VITRO|nr:hypothetical protein PVL29_004134 [Vitis rotundifolia]